MKFSFKPEYLFPHHIIWYISSFNPHEASVIQELEQGTIGGKDGGLWEKNLTKPNNFWPIS